MRDPIQAKEDKRTEDESQRREFSAFAQQIEPILKKYGWHLSYDHYFGWSATIVFYSPNQINYLANFGEYPNVSYLPPTYAEVVSFD